jgi:hypothetical protein
MKYIKKDLPTRTDLKEYYNINPSKRFNIKSIEYRKDAIYLNCKPIEGKEIIIPPFYQLVSFVNFHKNTFTITIEQKYFKHVITNFNINFEYLKNLNKSI